MTNIELYEYSKKHLEDKFDNFYVKNKIVIPESSNENNTLTQNNNELIQLISTFNTLRKLNKDIDEEVVDKIVYEIISILDTTKGINYSSFVQYFMVRNSTYSLYQGLKQEDKFDFIYDMLMSYCANRHEMYLSHGYSNIVLQVLADNYSHKRNGKTGIKKVLSLMKPLSLTQTKSLKKVLNDDNFIFLPDGKKPMFDNFLLSHNIEMKSRENEHEKIPDIVFNYNGQYFICELKMMKHLGGGQNKQTVEFANFIRYQEKNPNIHYITFLDGVLYNKVLFDNSPAINTLRNDIINCLTQNTQNYFLNTFSFIRFIDDLIDE